MVQKVKVFFSDDMKRERKVQILTLNILFYYRNNKLRRT